MKRSTEGETSLKHSTDGLYGSVTKFNPLLSEDKRKHTFTKKHLKDPQAVRNNIIWSDEPQFQASCLKETSCAHHLQRTVPKVKCAGISIMLWGCFSAAGTEGLVRVEENLNAPKYRDSLNENPVQSIQNLCFTFQQNNDPKHTLRVASTQHCV